MVLWDGCDAITNAAHVSSDPACLFPEEQTPHNLITPCIWGKPLRHLGLEFKFCGRHSPESNESYAPTLGHPRIWCSLTPQGQCWVFPGFPPKHPCVSCRSLCEYNAPFLQPQAPTCLLQVSVRVQMPLVPTLIQPYASCRSLCEYKCRACGHSLASGHLLDLHLSESHDPFLEIQAAKRMKVFRCVVEVKITPKEAVVLRTTIRPPDLVRVLLPTV